jgi:hypothetical protein
MTRPPLSRHGAEERDPDKVRPGRENPDPLEPEGDVDGLTDPVPEADDARVQRGWEETESMEGPAPTG